MKKLMLFEMIMILILVLSCTSKEEVQTISAEEQYRIDSVQAYIDSIDAARAEHSTINYGHIHAPGSDLALTAHQNPRLANELRERAIEMAPIQEEAREKARIARRAYIDSVKMSRQDSVKDN